jgi:hypothetical protein
MRNRNIAIIGSRSFHDYRFVEITVDALLFENEQPTIISGGAAGADAIAKHYALTHDFAYIEFPALWHKHGRSAGYIRNEQIVDAADLVLAFWNGKSPGTKHSIDLAKAKKKNLCIYNMSMIRRASDEALLRRGKMF